jgi:hypothetical protein
MSEEIELENENEEMSVESTKDGELQPKRTIRKWTPQEVSKKHPNPPTPY